MRRERWMWSGAALAVLVGLAVLQCGRDRSNPVDPQAGNFAGKPNAPLGVSATGSFGRIQVNWLASTITDLAGYGVYRSTTPAGTFTFLRGDVKGDTVITTGGITFVDSTFTGADTVYYYRVTAVNKNRLVSEMSNPARGELVKDTSPPGTPQNVTVLSDSVSGAVTLSWSPPRRTRGAGN